MIILLRNPFSKGKKSIRATNRVLKFSLLFDVHNINKITFHTIIESCKKYVTSIISRFVFFIKYKKCEIKYVFNGYMGLFVSLYGSFRACLERSVPVPVCGPRPCPKHNSLNWPGPAIH
jgi:hypothetical protein